MAVRAAGRLAMEDSLARRGVAGGSVPSREAQAIRQIVGRGTLRDQGWFEHWPTSSACSRRRLPSFAARPFVDVKLAPRNDRSASSASERSVPVASDTSTRAAGSSPERPTNRFGPQRGRSIGIARFPSTGRRVRGADIAQRAHRFELQGRIGASDVPSQTIDRQRGMIGSQHAQRPASHFGRSGRVVEPRTIYCSPAHSSEIRGRHAVQSLERRQVSAEHAPGGGSGGQRVDQRPAKSTAVPPHPLNGRETHRGVRISQKRAALTVRLRRVSRKTSSPANRWRGSVFAVPRRRDRVQRASPSRAASAMNASASATCLHSSSAAAGSATPHRFCGPLPPADRGNPAPRNVSSSRELPPRGRPAGSSPCASRLRVARHQRRPTPEIAAAHAGRCIASRQPLEQAVGPCWRRRPVARAGLLAQGTMRRVNRVDGAGRADGALGSCGRDVPDAPLAVHVVDLSTQSLTNSEPSGATAMPTGRKFSSPVTIGHAGRAKLRRAAPGESARCGDRPTR